MIFLILVPLFTSIIFVSTSMMMALKHRTSAYSHCYKTGFRMQKKMNKQIKKLLVLNKEVKEIKDETKGSSFTDFFLDDDDEERLEEIREEQKDILKKSRSLISKEWRKYKRSASHLIQNPYREQKIAPVAMFVIDYKFPQYQMPFNFSKKQKIDIHWTMNIFQFVPKWIRDYLNLNQTSKHSCSVTLKGKREKLNVQFVR